MHQIRIDFNECIGQIKPMNGVGQPPFYSVNFSMCDYLKQANIPYSRLHDVGGAYGRNVFVDIPNLFRDFNADPTDSANYDFAFTDLLITALVERGVEPIFRLGVTIETACTVRAYRIFPPADNYKWAVICEHIIRHYTEGWANGFHYTMNYWEIWNEPDNREDPMENPMWRGTAEEFFALYDVASKHLKATFPHLKIGGYGGSGFYALPNGTDFDDANPRWPYITNFFKNFIQYVKKNQCPLDFYSFHSYASTVHNTVIMMDFVRDYLDENGYTDTEMLLTEWSCDPVAQGTTKHAALIGGIMLALQDTVLDSAMFYDARCYAGVYGALFNCLIYKPFPAYYSFVAFGELLARKQQVSVQGLPDGVYCVAAKGADGCAVIANTNGEDMEFALDLVGAAEITECKIITEGAVWQDHTFANKLPKDSLIMIKCK